MGWFFGGLFFGFRGGFFVGNMVGKIMIQFFQPYMGRIQKILKDIVILVEFAFPKYLPPENMENVFISNCQLLTDVCFVWLKWVLELLVGH